MIEGGTKDQRSPQRRLIELQIEHADLDARVDQMTETGSSLDELLVRRLKKRRLALRDEMARLHRQIAPREPA